MAPMYENMIKVERGTRETLQLQIRRQIAVGIVNRQYSLDHPLPSIRRLAHDLEVSVTTVALAYEGLKQDGFVEVRKGAGYFVNPEVLSDAGAASAVPLPGETRTRGRGPADDAVASSAEFDFTAFFRGRSFNLPRVVKPADCLARYRYPFVCGLIDPSLFPINSWRACVRDSNNVIELENWATDYSSVDDELLVEQLIQRVLAKRGIVARPEHVLVTVGAQQALHLALRLLMSVGETLGVEDPGYPDVINMARIEGIAVERLPVDRRGLMVSEALDRCRCLFVTPSHQFPTTVTMPLERKLALLERTQRNGQFVIEDDYEADISFNMIPPPALKSLDGWGNVVYTGSLSKSLLPGLRIGYMVANPEFIREARALRHHFLRHPAVNNQKSVALFMQRGYYDRLVARITAVYKKRCAEMHRALERHFPGASTPPEYGGGSIWLRLPEDADAGVLAERVREKGVYFETGGFTFADERNNRNYIRLGYSAISRALIADGIARIAIELGGTVATPARRARTDPQDGASGACRGSRRRMAERNWPVVP